MSVLKKSLVTSMFFISSAFASTDQFAGANQFANLPAVTLQFKNEIKVSTKYAKLNTEQNFGLWIALDKENNTIISKIIQDPGNSITMNLDKTVTDIKNQIKNNEASIKEYFKELIDFQELKYYLTLLNDYFADMQLPCVGDINEYLTLKGLSYKPIDNKKIFANASLKGYVYPEFANIKKTIDIWGRKYNISNDNINEIDKIYRSIQQYIDNHIINNPNSYFSDNLSLSINSPDYTPYGADQIVYDYQKPFTLQFAKIENTFLRETYDNSSSFAEDLTTLSCYCYIPQVTDNQAVQTTKFDNILEKIEGAQKFLEERKRNSILKPNAGEVAKREANRIVDIAVKEIHSLQAKLHNEIDKLCDKLKHIFS